MVLSQYEKVAVENNETMDDENSRLRSNSAGSASVNSWMSQSDDAEESDGEAANKETESPGENHQEEKPNAAAHLPAPPDGGWGWMVVLGAIITGAAVPGLFMCFGVFMNAFLVVFPDASKSAASWIPSILNSLMNLMGPVTSMLVNKYSCRTVTLAGGIILSTGLVLSFFTNSIEALYFTYGFLGGVGSGLALAPGLYLISQYFQKRRGVATGVCMAASSAGQIAFPYLLQYLLDEYNYRGCILILGGITMNICVSGALYRPLMSNSNKPKSPKIKKPQVKIPKRKRTQSQISAQSFMAEGNSFADLSTSVLTSKTNHAQIVKQDPKKNKKAKNRKNPVDQSALKPEPKNTTYTNGSQPLLTTDQVIMNATRTRTRTLSIESNWVLPGIPEEEAEVEDEVPKETNDTDVDPNSNNEEKRNGTTVEKNNYLNNNVVNGTSLDKSPCSRPLLPQDVTVVVTVAEDDEMMKTSRYEPLMRQNSGSSYTDSYRQAISCMHHPFGSVASIVSFEQKPLSPKTSKLNQLAIALGFNYFKTAIFYILSTSFTCLIVILASYTMYMPTYGFSIGLTREESAGLISFISIASMCGRLIIPSIPDLVPIKRKHIYCGCIFALAGAVIMTALADSYPLLLTSLVFFGFTSGGGISISINVYLEYIPLKDFASFFGLSQLMVGVVVLFSSPFFGLLLDSTGSYTTIYIIMAILAVISGSIMYLDRFAKRLDDKQ